MRLADDRIDIAQRRRLGSDHVNVDAQSVGMKPDRLLHSLSTVDRVERRMGVKNHLAVLVDGVLASLKELVDVRLLDRMTAKLDLDIGNVADEAAGTIARPDVFDGKTGHALGEFDGFADRKLTR